MWHISRTVEVSLTLAEIQLIMQILTFEDEHLQLLKTQRCWWMCLGIFICCAMLSLNKYAEYLAVEQLQCKRRNTLVFCYVIAGWATDYKACSWTQMERIFLFKKYSEYLSYLFFFFFWSISLATETDVSFLLVITFKESSCFRNKESDFCELGSY